MKSVGLIHALVLQGHKCVVIVTADGLNFVTKTALASMGADVYTDDMYHKNGDRYGGNYKHANIMQHINLAKSAELIIVAPASANTISKLACGLADNLLTATILASSAPKALVPAMNGQMWHNPIIQENLKRLCQFGFMQWGPVYGTQACGDVELGRMLEVNDILIHIQNALKVGSPAKSQFFTNKRIVITAGSTIEPIDPVRYISNHSSGKMGYSLAAAAADLGALVTLISGSQVVLPVPSGINKFIKVTTADEMLSHAISESQNADIFIGCAAVCDYKVTNSMPQKIKKQAKSATLSSATAASSKITLELIENPDIIYTIKKTYPNLFVIGFAAETENVLETATKKLHQKNLDMMIANDVSDGKVFGENDAQVIILTKANVDAMNNGESDSSPIISSHTTDLLPKYKIAQIIFQFIKECF